MATSGGSYQEAPILIWFRRDLRLEDNPTVLAAVSTGLPIIPIFILEGSCPVRSPGAASLWWLDKALTALSRDLNAIGSRLILRRGDPMKQLLELAAQTGARRVFWSKSFEPLSHSRDLALASSLEDSGIQTATFNANLLFEPGQIVTGAGNLYSVFTPFWRAARSQIDPIRLLPRPQKMLAPSVWPNSDDLSDWRLHPRRPDWSTGFDLWQPGEAGAKVRLKATINSVLCAYPTQRDIPGVEGTSRLSPHLAWGDLGPRQIYFAIDQARAKSPDLGPGSEKYLAEIGWREFNYNILRLHPQIAVANLKHAFDTFPWRNDTEQVAAWQKGETGYPIVDAGMRELWRTGWMHNRVRMIVASFLVKHLLIDWRVGEAWFWNTLVDADPASNPGGWQWTAGSGADASPFFRIFNPISQAERFDPNGDYVRKWVPELAQLSTPLLHSPWTATPFELAASGIRLGVTYPHPIVDHAFARRRALAAFESLKLQGSN